MDESVLLQSIPGFPADLLLKWTLGDLFARMRMIAQFTIPRPTFDEALNDAFGRIEFTPEIWGWWDDEMRSYATECNRLADAACAAVTTYLRKKRKAG